jgi:hypothetical protein
MRIQTSNHLRNVAAATNPFTTFFSAAMTRIPGISKMLGGMRTDNTTNFSTLKTRLSASF